MMGPMARGTRSLSVPIILSSLAVALSVALLIGWIYVILRNLSLTKQYVQNTWLLVAGIVSFAVIVTVLVLFSVFLAREIKEARRQTSFMDSVTHEFRSPLASIHLCLETLARPQIADAQRETLRGMMLADVERLSALVDDILEASRLEHGRAGQNFSRVNLADLIATSVGIVRRRHTIEDGAITVDVPSRLELDTDPTALEIVIKNLVDNAVKYSDPPHRVHVAVTRDPGELRIRVRDDGVGLDRNELKRIFERFYRVSSEDVRARRGTGLGLWVVAALVRDMGGRVRASSDGLGKGTTMDVVFPDRPGVEVLDRSDEAEGAGEVRA